MTSRRWSYFRRFHWISRMALMSHSSSTQVGFPHPSRVTVPCDTALKALEKIEFLKQLYTTLLQHIDNLNDKNVICLGDFNIAIDNLDVVAGRPHAENVRRSLTDFLQNTGLTDSWRLFHPEERSFTWSRNNPPSSKRLDYLFVSDSLVDTIQNSTIKSIGFSDHRLVKTHFETSKFKQGKGIYKMNTQLLKDAEYCTEMIQVIQNTINEFSNENDQTIWEMIKINIRETSQRYSINKNRKDKDRNEELLRKMSELEKDHISNPDNNEILNKISQAKAELEIYEIEKTRGAQIRARIKDIEESEKCSKYFLAVEKFDANNNTIKEVRTTTGEKNIGGSKHCGRNRKPI